MRDFSYAARALRRSPGFTVTAMAVLALGIGSITAIFSVVNKVLLEPLPYPDPDRLVQLVSTSQLGNQNVASIPKYVVWRDNTNVFQDMAAYDVGGAAVNFTQGDLSETLKAARVSANYFHLFGMKMALGRTFSSRVGAISPRHASEPGRRAAMLNWSIAKVPNTAPLRSRLGSARAIRGSARVIRGNARVMRGNARVTRGNVPSEPRP